MKFLVSFIIGLLASTLIAECMTPSVISANSYSTSSYSTSWIGNSFSGGSKWVQNHIDGMYVAADGTVYTNSEWDEGGREAGIYKDGDVIGSASAIHGWGRLGGTSVTANSKYIYVAMQQGAGGKPGEDYPPSGTTWYTVRRYNLSGEPAQFSGGRGYDKSMLIVSTSSQIAGLANAGSELYVSDFAGNRIRVYNSDTMQDLRSWSVSGPQQIAVDRKGELWVIQKDGKSPKILHYSKTGTQLSGQITGIDATALAVDNQGRLLVAANGPSQQVLIYNITKKPTLVGTFGNKGGIYSGKRGEVGNLKFYGITGLGTDSAGNIYVNSNGFNNSGTDLRKFSPSGVTQWQLRGLEFVDNADADPTTDGVDVFTKEEHFVIDYTKTRGQEWIYKAYTLDKFRYPEDPRLHWSETSVFVRRIAGKRFLYLTDMQASHLAVFRFDGEIAVPCAILAKKHMAWPTNQPTSGKWIWRDSNGDGYIQSKEYESLGGDDDSIWGWEVDSKGDIWQASDSFIRHYRYQGADAHGSPIYSGAASEQISMPAPFNKLTRIKYFPAKDAMYLAGYTVTHPQTGNEWGIVGTEIVRYDNWSKKKKVRWRVSLPYEPTADPMLIIKAMDVAGDRVFAVDSRKAQVYMYSATTGAFMSKLTPGPEVAKESGWIDIPYGLRAYRRANGEYVVFVEEDWKAKVIMYRVAS